MTHSSPRATAFLWGALLFLLTWALVSPAVAQPCVEPPAGLVSWWPGEGAASDIQDGNHGTLFGGVTFSAGKVGQAFGFDGVSTTRVEIADSANLRFPGSFTFEAWVQTTSSGAFTNIVAKRHRDNGGTLDVGLDKTPDNVARFYLFDDAGTSVVVVGTTPINDGVFRHIVGVRDTAAGVARLYVDGVLERSVTDPTGTFLEVNAIPWNIGNTSGSSSKFPWSGFLDEVSIYNQALSVAEIQAIFTAGSAGKCFPGDRDRDGLGDDEDVCPASDLRSTVLIDACDTAVPNPVFPSGCTIADLIVPCAENAHKHNTFVRCVAELTNKMQRITIITGEQTDALRSCAAQANLP